MNLGGFAGGYAQGKQNQQRFELAQQEQNASQGFRNRQINIQESDEAERQAGRERDQAMRTGSAALFNKYYGEQKETVGETTSDDGNGGTTTVPTVKTTIKKPGEDAELDGKWAMENAMLHAQHSGMSMEEMARTSAMVDSGRRTAAGKALDKVLGGDESALGSFVTGIGKDPKLAKLDNRPVDGVRQIVFSDGSKPFDLRQAYAATATDAVYRRIMDDEKEQQGIATHKARITDYEAQATQRAAQANRDALESPARVKLLEAQAREAAQRGGMYAARGGAYGAAGGAGGKSANRDLQAAVMSTLPPGFDGKPDHNAAGPLLGFAADAMKKGAKSPAEAASIASKQFTELSGQARAQVTEAIAQAKKDPAVKAALVKQFGAIDADTLRTHAINRLMKARGIDSINPSAPSGNVGSAIESDF